MLPLIKKHKEEFQSIDTMENVEEAQKKDKEAILKHANRLLKTLDHEYFEREDKRFEIKSGEILQ